MALGYFFAWYLPLWIQSTQDARGTATSSIYDKKNMYQQDSMNGLIRNKHHIFDAFLILRDQYNKTKLEGLMYEMPLLFLVGIPNRLISPFWDCNWTVF